MSVVSIEFDTVSKQASVKMDGEVIPNVQDVCIYSYRDFHDEEKQTWSLTICQGEFDEESKVYKSIRLCANKDGLKVSDVEGQSVVEREIAEFFSPKQNSR